ncbi:MAG: GyrI-like domain-containing protein [Bacteroidota bacterium]
MKKIVHSLIFIVLGGLIWYLFIKSYDYTIRFESNTFAGAINQSLKLWDKTLKPVEGIVQNGSLYRLTQKLKFGDSTHIYQWKIKPLTDSTSRVQVNITDTEHSLMNKIKVPFSDTDFEKGSRKKVLDFMEELKDHVDKFKVTIVGIEEIPGKYVAYLPIKTSQLQKAGGMMKNFSYLSETLLYNQAEFNGFPMVEITEWDQQQDSLAYHLCYPIIRSERLPTQTDIQYKKIFPKRALKAEYYGNYITSDRAWYALLDYAKKNNISVEPNPIEVFHNNPSTDYGETTWKAEIYMPLREEID